MFEEMTFEKIMDRCLARVSTDVDKREGSIIYDAIAPAAAELAILYITLSGLMDRAFADTAQGEDLTNKAMERDILRQPSSAAICRGEFKDSSGALMEIPVGSRFSGSGTGSDLNYIARSQTADGGYRLECETPGSKGNGYFGVLFPIDYIQGLAYASITALLVPGEDEEGDESLRQRYYDSLNSQAYGGNVADYKNKVQSLPGVGAVKVFPVWNGGGTVKLVLVDSQWQAASSELVSQVQTAIDPTQNQGKGAGIAPIGHVVTVQAAKNKTVNIAFTLTFSGGSTWTEVGPAATAAVQDYFTELIRSWGGSDALVVRISQIESRILDIAGVIDITGTAINGSAANLQLAADEIPQIGTVTNNE